MSKKSGGIAVAVHACGFRNETTPCITARSRIVKAIEIAESLGVRNIIISGGVPYRPGAELLAHSIGRYLSRYPERTDLINFRIFYATNCFDSWTDTGNILQIAAEENFGELHVVSSYWHLWVLKLIYKYLLKKGASPKIHFAMPVPDPAGKKTVATYAIYATIYRTAFLLGPWFFEKFAALLSRKLSNRKKGYPVSGCD